MATETPTPIETLGKSLMAFHVQSLHAPDSFKNCEVGKCADARAALEDMEALLSTLATIVEKEELPESWDSDSWIDDNNYDDVHGHGMDAGAWYVAKQIRDALAKFQVKP